MCCIGCIFSFGNPSSMMRIKTTHNMFITKTVFHQSMDKYIVYSFSKQMCAHFYFDPLIITHIIGIMCKITYFSYNTCIFLYTLDSFYYSIFYNLLYILLLFNCFFFFYLLMYLLFVIPTCICSQTLHINESRKYT